MAHPNGERQWKWGVWNAADWEWKKTLDARNERLLPLQLEQIREGDNDNSRMSMIPRIIHHVWLGKKVIPDKYRQWMKTWQTVHPAWEHRLWGDADLESFPLINQKAFHNAKNYGEKSDILRYEILAKFGGVYADIDVACLKSFEPLVQRFTFVVGISNTGTVEINNGVMAATAQHPILLQLIDTIEKKSHQQRLDTNILALIAQMSGDKILHSSLQTQTSCNPMGTIERTGPGLLTRTFMNAIGWKSAASTREGFLSNEEKELVVALPVEFFYPLPNILSEAEKLETRALPDAAMAVHYWEKSWMSHQ